MKLALILLVVAVSVSAYDIPRKGLPSGLGDKAVDFKFSTDTVAPTISDVQLTSTTPKNVTKDGGSVTFTVKATDDVSGVEDVTIGVRSPDGMMTKTGYCQGMGGGDANKDKYTCSVYMSEYVQWGTWTMAWVNATDKADNKASVTTPLDGWVTKFDIQSNWDGTPPTLTSVTISPTTLTVGTTYQHEEVTITIGATDARSGVDRARFYYNYPGGASAYGAAVTGTTSISLSFNGKTTASYKSTSKFTYAGDYTLNRVELYDNAGNMKSLSADDLKAVNPNVVTTMSVTNNQPQPTIKEAADLVAVGFDRASYDATVKTGNKYLWTNITIATPSPALSSGTATVSLKSENGDWIDIRCRLSSSGKSGTDLTTVMGGNTMCATQQQYSEYQYKSGRYAVSGVIVQTSSTSSIDIFYTIYGQVSPNLNAAAGLRPSLLLAAVLALVALAFKS